MSYLVTDYYDYYLILLSVNSKMNMIYEMVFTHNTVVFIIFFGGGAYIKGDTSLHIAYVNQFYYLIFLKIKSRW